MHQIIIAHSEHDDKWKQSTLCLLSNAGSKLVQRRKRCTMI